MRTEEQIKITSKKPTKKQLEKRLNIVNEIVNKYNMERTKAKTSREVEKISAIGFTHIMILGFWKEEVEI